MALASSICSAISVNLSGGSTADVVRPFFNSVEWHEMEERRDANAQAVAEAQQIAKLRRMGHGQ